MIGLALLWASFTFFYIYKGAFDSLILWLVLPLMYIPLVYLSLRSKYIILFLFVTLSTVTNAVTPAYFFLNKNEYASSGWNSVNKFEFIVGEYLYINSYLWVFLITVTILALMINKYLFITPKFQKERCNSNYIVKSAHESNLSDNVLSANTIFKKHKQSGKSLSLYGLLLLVLIIVLSFLNSWMFGRGMSITGLDAAQELLPFKLNGILYYFTRFIVPVIIFYIYSRSSRSLILTILVVIYATFAGLSHVSRTTFILILFPSIYFTLKDQKYSLFTALGIISLFLVSIISQARNFVYLVVGGVATKGHDGDLFSLLGNVLDKFDDYDLNAVLFSMLNRVGGAQDIVLGFQYDTTGMGGYWANFNRVFLWCSEDTHSSAQNALYGFSPSAGFSTGSWGFSSLILQIAGGNLYILFVVAFWVGLWIALGDKIISEYVRIFRRLDIVSVFAFLFIFFFFASGHMSWFYSFIGISLFLVICGRIKITLRHSKAAQNAPLQIANL